MDGEEPRGEKEARRERNDGKFSLLSAITRLHADLIPFSSVPADGFALVNILPSSKSRKWSLLFCLTTRSVNLLHHFPFKPLHI